MPVVDNSKYQRLAMVQNLFLDANYPSQKQYETRTKNMALKIAVLRKLPVRSTRCDHTETIKKLIAKGFGKFML